jgi:hypothetical protein
VLLAVVAPDVGDPQSDDDHIVGVEKLPGIDAVVVERLTRVRDRAQELTGTGEAFVGPLAELAKELCVGREQSRDSLEITRGEQLIARRMTSLFSLDTGRSYPGSADQP